MTVQESDLALLLRALRFSARKHRDQRRKDETAAPYINHPIQVAHTLASVGGVTDVATLVAAVLHDTLEDTRTTAAELEEHFGPQVRSLVGELTDDAGLPRAERKRRQVEHARGASAPAKMIKLADKICNVHDVAHAPPSNWDLRRRREYLDWTEQVVAGCRGANPELERAYDEALREGLRALQKQP